MTNDEAKKIREAGGMFPDNRADDAGELGTGRWSYHIGDDYTQFYDGNDQEFFMVHGEMIESDAERIVALHNAFLGVADPVAAVEELKEAAEAVDALLPGNGPTAHPAVLRLRAAIAEARGEA